MKPFSVDQPKAMKQWLTLKATLESLGTKVEVIKQKKTLPDMVFATDQGIVQDKTVLLANFRYPQRQKERLHYRDWFRNHGFRLRALSNVFPFEGGDALFFDDMLLVGTGFRASVASCEELAKKLDIDVMPLRLVDPAFYHLDMCFLPVTNQTAFYYPPAFSENSRNLLKRLVPNLHTLSSQEANAYAANSFVSGKNILVQAGIPKSFHARLKKLDFRVIEVDVGEFNKAGGGIHCLINTIG